MGSRLGRSAAVISALTALLLSGALAAQAQAYRFRLTVTGATKGRPIPPDFLGLGLEYKTIRGLAGATPRSVDPVFVQLLRNLAPTGRPVIRVGGQSTDRTWWPVPGMARPRGVTYSLRPAWTAAARNLVRATRARLMLGINLEADRTRISQREGAQLVKRIGRGNIAALQVGNEPDLYPLVPWYKKVRGKPIPWYSKVGTPVYSRPRSYGAQDYAREFARTVKVLPRLPLAGPEAGTPPWLSVFSRFLSRHSRVRTLTSHFYGLNNCIKDPTQPQYPSVPHLLSIANSRDAAAGLAPFISRAHRDGGSYRIDEMGSVSCNGHRGVSDTLASALWLMDSLFDLASAGVNGVNLHSYPHLANNLFDFTRSRGRWWGQVHPLYYGALLFAQAAPAGSRLLRLHSPGQSRLRAWATLGRDRRVRVLLINDSPSSPARAVVRAPAGSGPAAVERLRAHSAWSTGGIILGGRSFGRRTPTGVLTPRPASVAARAGAYAVKLPAGSAALLTLPPRS